MSISCQDFSPLKRFLRTYVSLPISYFVSNSRTNCEASLCLHRRPKILHMKSRTTQQIYGLKGNPLLYMARFPNDYNWLHTGHLSCGCVNFYCKEITLQYLDVCSKATRDGNCSQNYVQSRGVPKSSLLRKYMQILS